MNTEKSSRPKFDRYPSLKRRQRILDLVAVAADRIEQPAVVRCRRSCKFGHLHRQHWPLSWRQGQVWKARAEDVQVRRSHRNPVESQ